jgi:protoporphyrinogen oxidase
MERTEIAVLGAGPSGIGSALRLLETGHHDFLVIDAADAPGGLASSAIDSKGFTWDFGGHVQFSHYAKFDQYMDLALPPEDWLWHERESWIWIKNRFVPYPFQNNLHRLDPEDRWNAISGLMSAHQNEHEGAPAHFEDWILQRFGPGIASLFLIPYNRKVWAHPLEQLDFRWVGERVAVPSLEAAIRSICLNQDQVSWGPNRRFRFPRRGGTGAIWRSLGARIPQANLRLRSTVASIDSAARIICMSDGRMLGYETLINTAPLNWLARVTGNAGLTVWTDGLKSSTVHVIGIGLRGQPPSSIGKMCWMYFPEADSSFYRVTVFSNYSPENVPEPGSTWSLMAEVSETPHRPVDRSGLVDRVIREMVALGLISDPSMVLSRFHKILNPGYPTPSTERDAILTAVLPALEDQRIYSRGRFGAWKYEVSNQDHAFMQGVEVVDRILTGAAEPTLTCPDLVNQGYNPFPQNQEPACVKDLPFFNEAVTSQAGRI